MTTRSNSRQPKGAPTSAPAPTAPPAPAKPTPAGPVMVDHYRLIRELGRGTGSIVYEAEDTYLGRHVALKVLRAEELEIGGRVSLERFRREAQILARLTHPNIVAVYGVGMVGRLPYIVMELVLGSSAAAGTGVDNGLDPLRATHIVRCAAQGLAAAHDIGVVHRDIKPGNILLGERGDVKVTDFGLARLVDAHVANLTEPGQTVGTPQYMSPEQCCGQPADLRSDIYSLGATFFRLLTGKAPFHQHSPLAQMYKHVGEPHPDPRTIRSDVPPLCVRVIDKSMEKDPARRFRSMTEMADSLRAVEASLARDAETRAHHRMATAKPGLDQTMLFDADQIADVLCESDEDSAQSIMGVAEVAMSITEQLRLELEAEASRNNTSAVPGVAASPSADVRSAGRAPRPVAKANAAEAAAAAAAAAEASAEASGVAELAVAEGSVTAASSEASVAVVSVTESAVTPAVAEASVAIEVVSDPPSSQASVAVAEVVEDGSVAVAVPVSESSSAEAVIVDPDLARTVVNPLGETAHTAIESALSATPSRSADVRGGSTTSPVSSASSVSSASTTSPVSSATNTNPWAAGKPSTVPNVSAAPPPTARPLQPTPAAPARPMYGMPAPAPKAPSQSPAAAPRPAQPPAPPRPAPPPTAPVAKPPAPPAPVAAVPAPAARAASAPLAPTPPTRPPQAAATPATAVRAPSRSAPTPQPSTPPVSAPPVSAPPARPVPAPTAAPTVVPARPVAGQPPQAPAPPPPPASPAAQSAAVPASASLPRWAVAAAPPPTLPTRAPPAPLPTPVASATLAAPAAAHAPTLADTITPTAALPGQMRVTGPALVDWLSLPTETTMRYAYKSIHSAKAALDVLPQEVRRGARKIIRPARMRGIDIATLDITVYTTPTELLKAGRGLMAAGGHLLAVAAIDRSVENWLRRQLAPEAEPTTPPTAPAQPTKVPGTKVPIKARG